MNDLRMIKIALLLCCFLSASACNSLFYHPDNFKYGNPASLEYKFEEKMLQLKAGVSVNIIRFHAVGNKKGTIVHFHGNAQNMLAHLSFTYWLPELGYDLYIFDYQGFGKSSGKPFRQATIDDGKAVLNEAIQNSENLPIFVIGQSLGASVSFTTLAQMDSEKICGLIFESGFASYRMIARKKLANHWFSWAFQYPLSFLISDELSPIDFVQNLDRPILFFHGTADKAVPYETGIALYNAYKGTDKTWIEIPNAGHTPVFLNNSNPYQKMALEFIESRSKKCMNKTTTEK